VPPNFNWILSVNTSAAVTVADSKNGTMRIAVI